MHEEALIHGTCLTIGAEGVLLVGKPGAGKSDLALRLIDQAGTGLSGRLREARLVADDQVIVRRAGDALVASAPPALRGKLEIRGSALPNLPLSRRPGCGWPSGSPPRPKSSAFRTWCGPAWTSSAWPFR